MANKTTKTDKPVAIKVQLDTGAYMPVRAHTTDSGYDVRVMSAKIADTYENLVYRNLDENDPWFIKIFTKLSHLPLIGTFCVPTCVVIDTGVHIQPEDGYWTLAVANSRSGKKGYFLGNGLGVIDQHYTGSIRFIYKFMPWCKSEDMQALLTPGTVCGQLIVMKRYDADFTIVEKLDETDRGDGGFGSTEKK